jgi:hypothetical protein
MKIAIVIVILFLLGSTSSAAENCIYANECAIIVEDSTSLGPVLQLMLEYPVDMKKLDSLKISTTTIELSSIELGMIYIFELEGEKLGECIGKRIQHKDSIWIYGMSNWQFQSFSTSSPNLPLLFGLTVGGNVTEIRKLFGQPTNSSDNELIYDYKEESGLRLTIGMDDGLITKIDIKKYH